jgi:hypothetical protein
MQKSLITKTAVCGILVLFIGAGALTGVGEIPENIDLGSKDDVLCGDCNGDGNITSGDLICYINWLYKGTSFLDQLCILDVNDDDIVNVGDTVWMITFLYRGGSPPNPDCCNPPWP